MLLPSTMTAHNTRRASLCQSFPSECMGGRVRGRGFACVSVRTVWGREGSTAGLLLGLRSPQWTGTATPVPLCIFRGYTSFTQRHRLPKQLRHLQSFESHPSTEEYNVPSISSALGLFPKSTNSGTHFSPTVGSTGCRVLYLYSLSFCGALLRKGGSPETREEP